MADGKHEPGKMDITNQQKTFDGFMRWVVNGSIVVVIILILLAITGT